MSRIQWISLILLTCGCIVKKIADNERKRVKNYFDYHLIFIFIQILSTSFAGVFNEFLLKDTIKTNVHIMIQNVFMYFDSIVCNIVLLVVVTNNTNMPIASLNNLEKVFSKKALEQLVKLEVIIIIINNAAIGIVTSLFLKSLNSILKTFVGGIELIFTSLLSWYFFSIDLDANTIVALFLVLFSTWLYSRNPVKSPEKSTNNSEMDENSSI